MTTDSSEKVVLPEYSCKAVLEQVNRARQALEYLIGRELTVHLSQLIGNHISDLLGTHVGHTTDTLLQYLGTLTREQVELLAWQFGGRKEELRRGPLQRYWRPTVDHWVPFECRGIRPTVWRQDEPGIELELFGLGFQPAGVTLKRIVSEAWTRFFAYQVGFNRRTQYDDQPKHLIGLWFWLHLKTAQEGDAQVEFDAWQMSPWMLKHNREIIKLRTRFDVDNGPECSYDLEIPCLECVRTSRECVAAVRRT